MNIAVIYGTPTKRAIAAGSADTDLDTEDSAEEVAAALELFAAPTLIDISEDTVDQVPQLVRSYDIVFNLVEWSGLDSHLSKQVLELLEAEGIPFTGYGTKNFAPACDKAIQKTLYESLGIPTPTFQVFRTGQEAPESTLTYPVICKVAQEHSSVGLSQSCVCYDEDSLMKKVRELLNQYNGHVIVEEFIDGQEYHVPILQTSLREIMVLPATEIQYKKSNGFVPFMSYTARWEPEKSEYGNSWIAEATIDQNLKKEMQTLAKKIFFGLSYQDYARIDLRVRNGNIFVLETNANPGLSRDPDYELTLSLKAAGMTFDEFIRGIVRSCLLRYKTKSSWLQKVPAVAVQS